MESPILTASSTLFLIPWYYAFINGQYLNSQAAFALFLTSIYYHGLRTPFTYYVDQVAMVSYVARNTYSLCTGGMWLQALLLNAYCITVYYSRPSQWKSNNKNILTVEFCHATIHIMGSIPIAYLQQFLPVT